MQLMKLKLCVKTGLTNKNYMCDVHEYLFEYFAKKAY